MAKRPAAAQTAFGPMVIVTVEQHYPQAQRLIQDDLAYQFLPLGMQVATRLCAWNVVRDLLIKLSERQAPGIWGSVLCRKRYADEKVAGAVAAGVDAVVVLGAGLDTRTYRLAAPAGVAAFEVDLPTNIDDKRAKVQRLYGRIPEHVTLVPIDFEIDNLGEVLAARGLDVAKRILFVWEAVTQYLTDAGVRKTFDFLAKAGTGSGLVFTYVRKDFIDGTALYGADRLYHAFRVKNRLWHFGIAPDYVDALLREYGWAEREQLGRREFIARYVEPAGRAVPVSEIERSVYAEKL